MTEYFFFFFFSSRRRHTRFDCDWSSDVCSSDLEHVASSPASTSEILTLYGRALLQDGQSEAAERTLEEATRRYPIDPSAYLYYSTAAEQQNHLVEARQALGDYGVLVAGDVDLVPRAM